MVIARRWRSGAAANSDPDVKRPRAAAPPNGVIEDVMTHWRAGQPMYEPAKIVVPTFHIHAQWDADLPSDQAHGLFAQADPRSVPALRRTERGNSHGDAGTEPHAFLPRDRRLLGRAEPPGRATAGVPASRRRHRYPTAGAALRCRAHAPNPPVL